MILETHGLTKTYQHRTREGRRSVPAVRGIDLLVKETEIFGLLGPNGAGKTTTLSMLTTLLRPDSGDAMVVGHDLLTEPARIRRGIGVVSQSGGLFSSGTARSELLLQCRMQGLNAQQARRRTEDLLGLLDLGEFADRPTPALSGGERRRVEIALGVVHSPKLLFLDEPTVGLDPGSRARLWEVIRGLRDEGLTVVLTTHYLDEADALCDRVSIIDRGEVVVTGTPEELKREVAGDRIRVTVAEAGRLPGALAVARGLGLDAEADAKDALTIRVAQSESLLPRLVSALAGEGIGIQGISVRRVSLDDVFLAMTGRSIESAAPPAPGAHHPMSTAP